MDWLAMDWRQQPKRFDSTVPPVERVLRRSEVVEDGCWLYRGSLDDAGYSCLRLQRRNDRGHRITWEASQGAIPVDRHLDHLCRTHDCVSIYHLEPVTTQVNTFGRAYWANGLAKTDFCSHGHAWTPENTYKRPDGKGRHCRQCIAKRIAVDSAARKARRIANQAG